MNQISEKASLQVKILANLISTGELTTCERQAIVDLKHQIETQQFELMAKSDLAKLYGFSMRTLNRRIMDHSTLYLTLNEEYGYTKYRKLLLPAEVELIQQYLGKHSPKR